MTEYASGCAGWDMVRARWLARQKAAGIAPADTEPPPLEDDAPAQESLTPDEQRVAARPDVRAQFRYHLGMARVERLRPPGRDQYAVPFTYTGTIQEVTVEFADDQQRDVEAEQRAATTED